MAVSRSELRGLIGGFDNDNLQARGGQAPSAAPVLRFARRNGSVELDLPTLRTRLDAESRILFADMCPTDRACYTPALVDDSRELQVQLANRFEGCAKDEIPFRWLVWTSKTPGVFSLGGDLTTFTQCIRSGDRAKLTTYAHRCLEVLHDNYYGMHLPVVTVALVQGDAVGGGFESMLSNDIVIAERDAKFGLPEVLFGLFPGMGGYSFLKRKLGEKGARALIEDGHTRSADEMKELGLIDVVCEPGQGEAALRAYVAENSHRVDTIRTLRRACKRVDPITMEELVDIVEMWIDLALQLGPAELKRMDCLARVQERRRARS